MIFHCHFPGPSDSYTLEEMKLRWSNDSDPVQTNEDLTLPQFELLDVKTHHCHKSYITGRLQVEVVISKHFGIVNTPEVYSL